METRQLLRWCISTASALVTFAIAGTANAQGASITGKVTSEQGREIQGANVVIPDLNISVATNAAGNYTIAIPAARLNGTPTVVRIRAIGYVPRSTTVVLNPGTQTANFSLAQDINKLEAVVTTGVTGATAQRNLPFAVSRLDESDMKVPAVNPLSQMQGKVPGATIVSASGRPGAAPAVLLRGPTAITGSGRGQSPLYIVDGVILSDQGSNTGGGGLPDINPQDIESIEVLKGAAAASLYGAYAGNGVITIRTKRGYSSTDGVHFNARTEIGTSDVENHILIAQGHALELDETGTRFCLGPASGVTRFQCVRTIDYATEAFRRLISRSRLLVHSRSIQGLLSAAPMPRCGPPIWCVAGRDSTTTPCLNSFVRSRWSIIPSICADTMETPLFIVASPASIRADRSSISVDFSAPPRV
jgi:TonB-dependent SusC/RagA subfamily outer membrane receptor